MKTARIGLVLLFGTASLASAQSTLSETAKHAYAANAGWIDFRTSAADGVAVSSTFLSGKAYAANFGWIHFGDGSPANGHRYANASGGDFGVNLDPSGALTGYAYAANVGWIAFEQDQGKPHLDYRTGVLTGQTGTGMAVTLCAQNCSGSSGVGTGMDCTGATATGCSALTVGGSYALIAKIAIGCVVIGPTSITHRYNMP